MDIFSILPYYTGFLSNLKWFGQKVSKALIILVIDEKLLKIRLVSSMKKKFCENGFPYFCINLT